MPRNVVIVSPYFPPSSLAGVHRARHLAKHLPNCGWTPIVLSVDPDCYVERADPVLSTLLPPDTEVVRVPALPARLARLFGIGDISLRAAIPLRRELMRLLSRRDIDAVLITGSPFYSMLLSREIKRRFGIPVVLDFQDPWVSNWGASQAAWSKARLAHSMAAVLEPSALRHADFVTSVSETQNAEMRARYAWLDERSMTAIPIGGDPYDFEALQMDENTLERDRIHLSYVGTYLPRSEALVRTLFRAFVRLQTKEPELAARIRINFVGTSNQPNDVETFRARPIAEEEGVAGAVREIPQRLPYLEALNWLVRSDGLLLIGSDEPHYTASKIYPALISGKPFLSLFHRASSAHAILERAGGGKALSFETAEQLAALEAPLAEGLRTLAAAPRSLGVGDATVYEEFTAKAVAARFAAVFDRLTARD